MRRSSSRLRCHEDSNGNGPIILEMLTYRYRGHSMSDPAKYRTKEEVDEVKKTRDPIDHLKTLLSAANATEDELKAEYAAKKAIAHFNGTPFKPNSISGPQSPITSPTGIRTKC